MTPTSLSRIDAGEPQVERIAVELGSRSYDVMVGEGLLASAATWMKPVLRRPRVVIVTDETVAGLHLAALQRALAVGGVAQNTVVLPAGEATKDFAHLEELCRSLLELRIDRQVTVVALGGGVVGDITGFAAGILLRGLDFVQIPTTLLAQVDSSVGGKTGINTSHGKNLVGVFHQPRLVLADVASLATLDVRERQAGYAEVVKYGLIGDAQFFAWLETHGASALALDMPALRHVVAVSCLQKADIVAKDEREEGLRALLNLGHTFGHALEAETGFGSTLLHGEAVAIGLVLAFALSVRLELAPKDDLLRVRRLLTEAGLRTDLSWLAGSGCTAERLMHHMHSDKKIRDNQINFILARGIGHAFVCADVPVMAVAEVLQTALQGDETEAYR